MADIRDAVFNCWRGSDYWEKLVEGDPERVEGFGDIYTLMEPNGASSEGLALVDMREFDFIYPRYNQGSVVNYRVLHGYTHCGVGNDAPRRVKKGGEFTVPAGEVHFMAIHELVVVVTSAPYTSPDRFIPVDDLHPAVPFNKSLFRQIAYGQPS